MKTLKTFENFYIDHKTTNNEDDQLRFDFNKNTEFNGIIYCSSKNNKDEYYLLFILDKSKSYLYGLDINTVEYIKMINDDISGEFERITGKDVPANNTFLIETLNKMYENCASYGFVVDDDITDDDIIKTIEYINSNKVVGNGYPDRTYHIIKFEKIK